MPSQQPIRSSLWQYRPLFTIALVILIASLAVGWNGSVIELERVMSAFMAGFFLVFSGFKLLDIPGFARGYAQYDLLAMHWRSYGFVYPFLELILGLGYILIPTNTTLNIVTAVLMAFSGIGVTIKLLKRETFQCACLGTFIKVPLTAITFVEDFGMATMALLMLW
jgi:hypothetical protein